MDFALCYNYVPPFPWFELTSASGFKLFVHPETGRHAEWCATKDGFALAYGTTCALSNMTAWMADNPRSDTLSDAIGGGVAGVVVTQQAIFVFRDKLGLIPLVMIRNIDRQCLIVTTSPDLTDTLSAGKPIHARWLAHYLCGHWDTSVEDVMTDVCRVLPGEVLCIRAGLVRRQKYWPKSSFFRPLDVKDTDEAVRMLRNALVDAVGRIPQKRQAVYTLSGGLDSGGIVAISCAKQRQRDQRLTAVSLISKKYPTCDESREIGIMANALPIDVHLINMDAIQALSETEAYHMNAFGPVIMPGLETTLTLFRFIAQKWPDAQIITGYGGNYLMALSVRAHAHDLLIRKDFSGLFRLLKTFDRHTLRVLMAEQFSAMCDGKIRLTLKNALPAHFKRRLFASENPCELGERWLKPAVALHAPGTSLQYSLAQERLYAVCSWNNELRMRALDRILRATRMEMYDPLFDPELYEVCARLPASFYDLPGLERAGYRQALSPFLPGAILDHPKIQNFNDVSRFDQNREVQAYIDHVLNQRHHDVLDAFIQWDHLKKAWSRYTAPSTDWNAISYDTRALFWRSLSLCL